MPAVQTSYSGEHRSAFAGMIASQEPAIVISRVAQGAIAFGSAVVQGTADRQVKAPAAGAAFRGVAVTDTAVAPEANDAYADGYTAAVLTKGVVWVVAAASVAAGQAAFFDAVTGAISGDTADTAIPNAIFDSTAAPGGLVKLRLA